MNERSPSVPLVRSGLFGYQLSRAVDRLPDAVRPGDHVVARRRRAGELVDLVREDEREPVAAPTPPAAAWYGPAGPVVERCEVAVLALHEHALALLRLDARVEAVAADPLRPLAAGVRGSRARAELAVGRAVVLRAGDDERRRRRGEVRADVAAVELDRVHRQVDVLERRRVDDRRSACPAARWPRCSRRRCRRRCRPAGSSTSPAGTRATWLSTCTGDATGQPGVVAAADVGQRLAAVGRLPDVDRVEEQRVRVVRVDGERHVVPHLRRVLAARAGGRRALGEAHRRVVGDLRPRRAAVRGSPEPEEAAACGRRAEQLERAAVRLRIDLLDLGVEHVAGRSARSPARSGRACSPSGRTASSRRWAAGCTATPLAVPAGKPLVSAVQLADGRAAARRHRASR